MTRAVHIDEPVFYTIAAAAVPAEVVASSRSVAAVNPADKFDYGSVSASARHELQAIVTRVRDRHQEHLEAVVAIGADLLKAKELVGHGNWLPWLRAEFGWTERTAQMYMLITERVGDKYEAISYLPLSHVAALSAKSTPPVVLGEIVDRSAAGERLDPFVVKSMIADAKELDRKAKAEARKTPEQRQKEKQKADRSRQARAAHRARYERERAEEAALDRQHRERITEAIEFLRRCLTAEQVDVFRWMIAGIPTYKLGEPLSSMR